MNRLRLASRLKRMGKLLELRAPRTIILSEMRMVNDAFIDCEQHGYESDVTNNSIDKATTAALDAAEAAHEKHMDHKPDPECDLCQLEEAIIEDVGGTPANLDDAEYHRFMIWWQNGDPKRGAEFAPYSDQMRAAWNAWRKRAKDEQP